MQKSDLKWLRYCCNAKNDHQRHHLCPALKPVLVVWNPKCGTIIKIHPFIKFYHELKFEVHYFLGPLVDLFRQNEPPYVLAVKTGSGGFRPQAWHHCHDISLLTSSSNFMFVFLGPLVYLFPQNVPPEARHVPAVKTCSGGFRPQVWHHYQEISLL